MSLLVRPATAADIEPVAALLHGWMNPKIPAERWRRIPDYPWRPRESERGWLVEDRGRVVGFMATIYSDRPTGVGKRRFCDLGAWYLMREHRGNGIGETLLEAGMAKPGVTYATMTARAATGRRIRALGFRILDDTRRIFRRTGEAALSLAQADEALLPEPVSRRLRDHRALNLRHTVFAGAAGPVLVMYQVKRKGADILHHDLLYASDLDFLRSNAQAIADAVIEEPDGVFAVDSRFMGDCGDGEAEAIPLPRWYRSLDVSPADVDHLYAETLLLDMKLP